MTPERLAELSRRNAIVRDLNRQEAQEIIYALETERARLDCLTKLRPGELFDALSDPRGLRAVLDERIAEREKGAGG